MTRRGERITLLLIMALGALVRVSAMWKRVLLDDEVGIAGATGKTYGHILSEFGGKVTQPAQLLLARLARETLGEWIGVDAALRLPSLVFGVLAIALTARLARRIAGPEVAPFAALVVALHPFHVFYSQMATTYALASTLSLLSFLLFVDLVRAEARGARVRAGYVVATALAIYAHLGAVGVVAGQVLCLAFVPRGGPAAKLRIALVAAAAGGTGLLLYAPVWSHMLDFRAQWTEGEFSFDFVPFALTGFAGGRGLAIYALVATSAVGLAALARSAGRREALSVVVLWPAGVFLFYYLNGSSHYPWANTRFLFLAFPAVALVLGVGLRALAATAFGRAGVVRTVAAGGLLAVFAASQTTKVAEIAWGAKDAYWPEVFAYLEASAPPGTVLISMPMRFSSLEHYDARRAGAGDEGRVRVVSARDLRKDLVHPKDLRLKPPVAFAVDLVPFEGPPWDAGWVVRRFGSTTILFRDPEERSRRNQHLRDLVLVTARIADYLERPPVAQDWTYWRIDPGHQHLFRRLPVAMGYRELLEAAATQVPSAPARSNRALDPEVFEEPFWDMLAPHVDFLPAARRDPYDGPKPEPERGRRRRTEPAGAADRDEPTPEQEEQIEALQAIGYASGATPADEQERRGVTVYDRERAGEGFNLVVSAHGPEVLLLDMGGDTVHRWHKEFGEVWPGRFDQGGGKNGDSFRRARLLPGGELLAIYEGLGLIALDRHSNLLWSFDGLAHHDLDVGADGRIYVLTRAAAVVPRFNPRVPILADFIAVLEPDGTLLETVSLIDCFERSGHDDVLAVVAEGGDVFHTNAVSLLDGRHADRVPAFARGRLLISLRRTSTIAVVDLAERTVPWVLHGDWRAQHEPLLLESGNLLLFDNRGTPERSRVLELDPATGAEVWSYQADEPGTFYTPSCGSSQRLSNGNTLITESESGRAFEVTPDGTVVWELLSPHRVADPSLPSAARRAGKLAARGLEYVANLFEVTRIEPGPSLDWLE